MFQSSNIPESSTGYLEYNTGTTYIDGQYCISSVSGVHRIYESLQNGNLNNPLPVLPLTSTAWWLEVGATNPWKVFDAKVQSQSQVTSQAMINWVVNPGLIDSITLLNIDATSTQIIMADQNTNLVINGTAWTGATGVTPPNSWDLVGSPSDFLIDSGALKITADAANEGISQTMTVVAGTEMQLLGIYRNTAGDVAQYAIDGIGGVLHGPTSVTQANMHISAVDGIAFIDFSTADLLTDHLNKYLKITDSAGKEIKGYIKAAGTGETLDSELLTGFTNNGFDTFTTSGVDISSAIKIADGVATGYSNLMAVPSLGTLFKLTRTYSKTSGTDPDTRIGDGAGLSSSLSFGTANTAYRSITNIVQRRFGYYTALTTNFSATGNSLKQVLAPSATGVTIVSAKGGTTYNWESKDADFNYNDSSGYTYTIYETTILATTDLVSSVVNSTLSYVFTVPAGCISVKISLMAKTATDIVWFDTVSLSEVVYNKTTSTLTTIAVVDWYTYFFEPIIRATDIMKTDLAEIGMPPISTASVTIIVTYTAGTAKCGEIVMGLKFELGRMKYNPSIGIIDYSIKSADAFGNYSITTRAYSKRMSCDLVIKNTIVDEVFRQLALYRSTPVVYVGSEVYSALIIYGFYKSFEIVIPYPNYSECLLELEGLT